MKKFAYFLVCVVLACTFLCGCGAEKKTVVLTPQEEFAGKTLSEFMTSEKDYALEAYTVHPFDFLVKPFDQSKIDALMKDLEQEFIQEENTLEIRVPFGTVHVPVSQIVSVVSRGHTVDFKMENGNVVTSSLTFSEIVNMFQPYKNFLNINRGVLINMDRALFLKDGCIVMSDRQPYPLRVREQASLIRIFTQYQIKHRMKGI